MKPALILAIVCGATAFADEVYLKGGGKVSGRITQRTATSVEVEVGAGRITVPTTSVDKIVEGRSALDGYHERAGKLAPSDRDGWAALGRWASDQGLSSQSREAYHRVLAIDPNDAEANAALGNTQVNGRWLTEDEGYRAKGFVQYQGEWMTPGEQAARDREREADRARAAAEAKSRQAEARAADEAAARAKADAAAQQEQQEGLPLWWGWGPGPVVWPTQPVARQLPARSPR
jgi:hypothetical protein